MLLYDGGVGYMPDRTSSENLSNACSIQGAVSLIRQAESRVLPLITEDMQFI
jgi:hypothetical protein